MMLSLSWFRPIYMDGLFLFWQTDSVLMGYFVLIGISVASMSAKSGICRPMGAPI